MFFRHRESLRLWTRLVFLLSISTTGKIKFLYDSSSFCFSIINQIHILTSYLNMQSSRLNKCRHLSILFKRIWHKTKINAQIVIFLKAHFHNAYACGIHLILSIYSKTITFCWLRKALHIFIRIAILNHFIPLNRVFSFCKIHFTGLYLPFVQSQLFSR